MKTRRQVLGQNFLRHRPTIEKITQLVDAELSHAVHRPKALLEIGPGGLALTKPLQELASARGLPLVLVERDPRLEDPIRAGATDAEIHFMDAATEKLGALFLDLQARGHAPLFVASNLPYSAGSRILANLCHLSGMGMVSGAVVMVQKEVAERMAAPAASRDRGAFSLLIQCYFEPRIEFDVGPGAFHPPPKVTSTVLALRPLSKPKTAGLADPLKFEDFCKRLFSQRRKMIRGFVPRDAHAQFGRLGLNGTERPETLELDTVLELFRVCGKQS
ncbi:MAG: hypothetical protein HYW49_12750 [Deltaproteobacteria bacterium]|nr:hypothetical protein [Deltaproteobacteria bacterium]